MAEDQTIEPTPSFQEIAAANAALPSAENPPSGYARATLTPRCHEILTHIADGEVNAQIAAKLGISIKTVEAHRVRLFKALNVENAPHAVAVAFRLGLLK